MQNNEIFDTLDITVSSAAIEKIKEVMDGEDASCLRIFVSGGGCAGFSYGFTIDNESAEDDITSEIAPGIKLAVDSISAQYLIGSFVDYVEDDMVSSFKILNPNAESTCGCGSSFSPY